MSKTVLSIQTLAAGGAVVAALLVTQPLTGAESADYHRAMDRLTGNWEGRAYRLDKRSIKDSAPAKFSIRPQGQQFQGRLVWVFAKAGETALPIRFQNGLIQIGSQKFEPGNMRAFALGRTDTWELEGSSSTPGVSVTFGLVEGSLIVDHKEGLDGRARHSHTSFRLTEVKP